MINGNYLLMRGHNYGLRVFSNALIEPTSTLLSVVSRLNHWHEIAHQNPAFVSSQFIRPEEPTRAAINSGTAIGHVSIIWGNVSDWIACQNVINLFLFSSFSLKIPIGKLCGRAGAEH